MNKFVYGSAFAILVFWLFFLSPSSAWAQIPQKIERSQISVTFYSSHELIISLSGVSGSETSFSFTDKQPFDTHEEYVLKTDCGESKLNMNDQNSTTATFEYKYLKPVEGQTTTCVTDTIKDLPIPAISSTYDAYKINEDIIFMQHMGYAPLGCSSNAGGGNANFKGTKSDVKFSRRPAGKGFNAHQFIGYDGDSPSIADDKVITGDGIPKNGSGWYINDLQSKLYIQNTCLYADTQRNVDIQIGDASQIPEALLDDVKAAGIDYNPETGEATVTDPEAEAAGPDPDSCEVRAKTPLSFIVCPVLNAIGKGIEIYRSQIEDLLNFDLKSNDDSGSIKRGGSGNNEDNLKAVWGSFRNIANILFVIAFLFIIISQAIGGKF